MKIFHSPRTRSSRAIWMLEETGVDYDVETLDIMSNKGDAPADFFAASPMGKVPALIDGDVAMSESAAICLYLADRYAPGRLSPAIDDPKRGKFLYWIMYTPAVIEPAMIEKVMKLEPNPGRNGWGSFDSMIETLESGLDGKSWILGDEFSAADVMLGSSAVFLRLFDMLPDSKILTDYADRCLSRPAYEAALNLDGH